MLRIAPHTPWSTDTFTDGQLDRAKEAFRLPSLPFSVKHAETQIVTLAGALAPGRYHVPALDGVIMFVQRRYYVDKLYVYFSVHTLRDLMYVSKGTATVSTVDGNLVQPASVYDHAQIFFTSHRVLENWIPGTLKRWLSQYTFEAVMPTPASSAAKRTTAVFSSEEANQLLARSGHTTFPFHVEIQNECDRPDEWRLFAPNTVGRQTDPAVRLCAFTDVCLGDMRLGDALVQVWDAAHRAVQNRARECGHGIRRLPDMKPRRPVFTLLFDDPTGDEFTIEGYVSPAPAPPPKAAARIEPVDLTEEP